ncbi:MAG: hypothetical protein K6F33_01600, partial [Bacteroidales bacterium]|nr:hypothetical protein [Bacteroidales bacterium]
GLKKHLDEVKQLGITADDIQKMEEAYKTLLQKDAELEAFRQEAAQKSAYNRQLLSDLKNQMLAFRRAIKSRYMQPEWIKYGVQDKR